MSSGSLVRSRESRIAALRASIRATLHVRLRCARIGKLWRASLRRASAT